MDFGPLFPGMVNTVGALLPAMISIGIVVARRARSGLGMGDQFWLVVFSLALSAVLARVTITSDETLLHIVPGATVFVCYLVWCGYHISPGSAFALTYATNLPVDFFLAQLVSGPEVNSECIGGGGWAVACDSSCTHCSAVMYANWRIAKVGRARLFWFGQRREMLFKPGIQAGLGLKALIRFHSSTRMSFLPGEARPVIRAILPLRQDQL